VEFEVRGSTDKKKEAKKTPILKETGISFSMPWGWGRKKLTGDKKKEEHYMPDGTPSA
jgi:hypothetical protein